MVAGPYVNRKAEERGFMANVKIGHLISEMRNPKTQDMDCLTVRELLEIMNEEDACVPAAIGRELASIERAIGLTVEAVRGGGRVFYVGSGTSGRIGVMDAVECAPTFGCTDEFQAVLAGGSGAFIRAAEGTEDDTEGARADMEALGLTDRDVVIGIAASGRTPYTVAAVTFARERGCRTIGIANNKQSELGQAADVAVEVETGPEVLTGSTRLKAASAQKMVCNMISTITMKELGKTYKNLMVDMRPTNGKLEERARRIVMEATGCAYEAAEEALIKCGQSTKTAIVMLLCGCNAAKARELLAQKQGSVAAAVKTGHPV